MTVKYLKEERADQSGKEIKMYLVVESEACHEIYLESSQG